MVSVSLSPEVVKLMDAIINQHPHFKNRPTFIEYLVFDYFEKQKNLRAQGDALHVITSELRGILEKSITE